MLATVSGGELSPLGLGLRFVLGAAGAVLIGLGVAWLARRVLGRVTDATGRSALTLVLPFATYLAAEELGASGVIAVVVLALQLRAGADADEAAERLTQSSLWNVVELLVTGLAFGLIGLDLRLVVLAAGDELPTMLAHAAVVCVVVVAVRVLWMVVAWRVLARDADGPPRPAPPRSPDARPCSCPGAACEASRRSPSRCRCRCRPRPGRRSPPATSSSSSRCRCCS